MNRKMNVINMHRRTNIIGVAGHSQTTSADGGASAGPDLASCLPLVLDMILV